MGNFQFTEEQQAIVDTVHHERGHLVVTAYAGAAKSTTAEEASDYMPGGGIYVAFNVTVKEAMEAKFVKRRSKFSAKTMNGLGHNAWQSFVGKKLTVKGNKIPLLIREAGIVKKDEKDDFPKKVAEAVNAARALGLVPTSHEDRKGMKIFYRDTEEGWTSLLDSLDIDYDENVIEAARAILGASIELGRQGVIDYADQIYLPCIFNVDFRRYPNLIGDEIQDFSELNIHMIRKTLGVTGRFMGVGDPNQSIYAFRGADSESIPKIIEAMKPKLMKLTTTFRCREKLVENLHWRTPDMKHAPWNTGGIVKTLDNWSPDDIQDGSFIVCRNNAPLFATGFALLNARRKINFISRGIEYGLRALVDDMAEGNELCPVSSIHGRLEEWRLQQYELARASSNDNIKERADDKAEAIMATPGQDAISIKENITKLLSATDGSIALSTIHKAKGLEADTTYHLDSHLIRDRGDTGDYSEKQIEQEKNARYVADSRARNEHYYITKKGLTR